MNIINKCKKLVKHPAIVVEVLMSKTAKYWTDKTYLSILYRIKFGHNINWDEPKTFCEKLNWMKINYRNPLFTMMADKYWVKQYVEEKIGAKYVVPCYGCWKSVDEIDFESLPERSFLKSTHDSGGGILIDKTKDIDMERIRKRFNKKTLQKKNWYWYFREFPYKNIEPRIIAEKYLDEGTGYELHDYKFYCFNGEPAFMYVTNKADRIFENYYDLDFKPVDISHGFERHFPEFTKPKNFEKMIELARILSTGMPFIRIDFFNVKDKLYFGEFTFYDWGGMKPLNEPWESHLGEKLLIPKM